MTNKIGSLEDPPTLTVTKSVGHIKLLCVPGIYYGMIFTQTILPEDLI